MPVMLAPDGRAVRALVGLVFLVTCIVAHPSGALAQRRTRPRAPQSPFAAALVQFGHLDDGSAVVVEERVRAVVHRELRDPRSMATNILLRSLTDEGLSYVEASVRVDQLGGRDAASADIMNALARFFASAPNLLYCAMTSMGLGLRVDDCEAARAAITHTPAERSWEPGDGRAWAIDLEARGRDPSEARRVAAAFSDLMRLVRRPNAPMAAAALFTSCPSERVDGLERLRRWDRGATPEMVRCIANAVPTRDGGITVLRQAFHLSWDDAAFVYDTIDAYRTAADASAPPPPLTPAEPRALDPSEAERSARPPLTADDIRSVVSREQRGLQACWEVAIRGMSDVPTVRMDVDITIGASGTVTHASARGMGVGNVAECIERTVRRWRFPAASDATRTAVPVVFQGSDPNAGAAEADEARRALAEHRTEVDACWTEAIAADSALVEAATRLRLHVTAEGSVSAVEADGGPSGLRTCVARMARRWRFPRADVSGRTFEIPLRFRQAPTARP